MKSNVAKICILVAVANALFAGCSSGVPQVDPHHPMVNGVAMTQSEFLNKYCTADPADRTCVAVRKAMNSDSTKGEMPKGY